MTPYQLNKLRRITENELDKMILKNQTQPGLFETEMRTNMDDTLKQLDPRAPMISEREVILRNTLGRINAHEGLRQGGHQEVTLFGAPGYEIMMDDQAFDLNKKNILLSEDLGLCL